MLGEIQGARKLRELTLSVGAGNGEHHEGKSSDVTVHGRVRRQLPNLGRWRVFIPEFRIDSRYLGV